MSVDIGHQFNIATNFLDPSVTAQHELLPLKGEKKQIQISSILDRVPKSSAFFKCLTWFHLVGEPSFEKWVVIHHQAGIAHMGFIYSR